MPQWLCNQMMRAFLKKDRRQIKLLNECWYFYRNRQIPKTDGDSSELTTLH
ncbi:cortex morphogenetic protein CmpA [Paenibacillus sp. NEAU-GSW1]|uniref:cortex morphogenetic protein CmpA n=1 Tax=Paenibacillus sp. NEAU-GSW1 TaxID=2682486 RepID=UPI0012E0D327|nr:cortex morphogenetic protein CmpA [Paenibacillus sp. NEAU-GSW1]MUT67626.1 cortex morphogenetic protein CmpA [Paenibacillus sp. NEAU-GSW1]